MEPLQTVEELFREDRAELSEEPSTPEEEPPQEPLRVAERDEESHLRFQEVLLAERQELEVTVGEAEEWLRQPSLEVQVRLVESLHPILQEVPLEPQPRPEARWLHPTLLLGWRQWLLEELPPLPPCLRPQQALDL